MPSLLKRTSTDQFGKEMAPRIPDWTNAHALAAATNEADTPPAGATQVVISTNLALFVKMNAVAAVPADTTDGSAAFYIAPNSVREFTLDGVTSINMIGIAAETPLVTLSYYK